MQRRDFIKKSLLFTASIIVPSRSFASLNEKSFTLYNIHTGEKYRAIYWANGKYIYDEIANLEYILRDYRNNEIHKIDVKLFDYLYDLHSLVESNKEILVISGYRSPATNTLLRKHHRGVAKNSYHTKGMAVDIRIPDVRLSMLRYAALSLKRGGIGYYPRSNFIHIDTANPRYWRYPKR
ncbi:DUF882 domain-containing protein [Nitratiruptor tergarcus]|uniref:Murein endopeptidase K n=1 Tax=Nitratiruptor tergarcus DSM 16512 TaxID=1069081 RepID=A0A1W1WTF2_9BACT|nr:DUF882 domain-containing protein [Nitratiruptor tergarcus]SMC09479.1 Uncharacterized conserved protein YcbK, DUF882 family [Nitratiruptor tergarcus DSM 16512]